MLIDLTTEFGARVGRRLREEQVIWLTTVRADRTPQPSPVWFLWDEETFLIYSQPNTPKLRNIAQTPIVSLNFNGDVGGNDIVIVTGVAAVAAGAPPVHEVPAFVQKYQGDLSSPARAEQMGRDYSVAIRVTPTGLRGF